MKVVLMQLTNVKDITILIISIQLIDVNLESVSIIVSLALVQ